MFKKSKLESMAIPVVEAVHVGGKQRPTAIVLRSSFTTGEKPAALGIANAWRNPYSKVDSCHYVVDEARVYNCVPVQRQARPYGVSEIYNGAISVNVCHNPPEEPSVAVVERAALVVARLCKRYRVKPRILAANQKRRWLHHKWRFRGGIILNLDGDFPADKFADLVSKEYETL